MNVFLENIDGNLRFNYSSEHATGSMYVHTPDDLVKAIEEVCGKGIYCLYRKGLNSQRTVVPFGDENYKIYPTITYWQQGVKTGVIEQSRKVAMVS